MSISGKQEREVSTEELLASLHAELDGQFEGREKEITGAFRALTKKVVRHKTITEHIRIDGRGVADIRTLSAEVGVLPRVHGSALFQRGETQILGVTTLNMLDMEQKLDTLAPETPSGTCTTTTSRPTPPVRPAASVRRSVGRSATALSLSAP
jgi:polyribonucleotide nucleotidyltransferase